MAAAATVNRPYANRIGAVGWTDVVATTAEEAENPKRDLPIGIIGSLVICTLLYCGVAIVMTGMVNYKDLTADASLATAFEAVGKGGYATLISAGVSKLGPENHM